MNGKFYLKKSWSWHEDGLELFLGYIAPCARMVFYNFVDSPVRSSGHWEFPCHFLCQVGIVFTNLISPTFMATFKTNTKSLKCLDQFLFPRHLRALCQIIRFSEYSADTCQTNNWTTWTTLGCFHIRSLFCLSKTRKHLKVHYLVKRDLRG